MRVKIQKKVIKMIKIITLIPASVVYLMIAACGSNESNSNTPNPEASISGAPAAGSEDPLKQLQDEGKLPPYGTGPKTTPGNALSVYPPDVDPDQDNVPNAGITGQPDIAIDNCPNVFNPGQEDGDGDGVGNACES